MISFSSRILLGQEVTRIHHSLGGDWVFVCFDYSQHWFGSRPWLALVVFRGLWLLSWWLGLAPWWLWHDWRIRRLRIMAANWIGFRTSSLYYLIVIGSFICLIWPRVLIPYWPSFSVIAWILVRRIIEKQRSRFR